MLRLDDPGLDDVTRRGLARFQAEVDTAGRYANRVAKGKDLFSKRNKKTNRVFRVVRRQLAVMSSGAQRCGYCEDSVGDEVEHIKPKDLYPEVVFDWDNYLLSCGPCNTGKSNKFAVIDDDGNRIVVTRRRGAPVVPPAAGQPALVNPRFENPLDYLDLEISRTFIFLTRDGISGDDEERADFTIGVLKLNRDVLLAARANAYGSYRARLFEYGAMRDDGARPTQLTRLTDGIRDTPHPTVWQEMKRQHALIPELRGLFADVPEAMAW